MGTAKILQNLGQAAYKIQVIKDVDRVEQSQDRCRQGITDAEAAQAQAETAEGQARAEVLAAGDALTDAIAAAAGNSSDPRVLAAQDRLDKAATTLENAQQAVALAKLKKLAFEKELATYNDITTTEDREAWCVDATDDLDAGETVGTVEINQESTQMLVAPGGAAPDSILQPGMANDGVATWLNWGLLPGVQRWRPTYRVGTIKGIDYDADTCTVCLDDARSSAQNIKINPPGAECETQKDGPQGFIDFCKRQPGHPACQANGSAKLTYSDSLRSTIDAINERINRDNRYSYDSAQYGRLENWVEMAQSGGTGDCEDFALSKYRACLNAGIPASALKLATGKTSTGTGHAWLEVQTDRGSYALDLNAKTATLSDDLPYSNRAVQADGTNWSGKGLLVEDVPIEYMQCNASAFQEGDRVVVYFKESSWLNPCVIGFEEKPQQCGLCVLYRKDGEYKSSYAVFKKGGVTIVPNTIVGDKITGLSGRANFFRRTIEIDVEVVDKTGAIQTTTTERRSVVLYISPLVPDEGKLNYRADPTTMETDGEFYVWRVAVVAQDVETGAKAILYITQSMPGTTISVEAATGNIYNGTWGINWSSETIFLFEADGIMTGNYPPSTGTAYAYGLKLTKTVAGAKLSNIEKAARPIPTGTPGNSIAVSSSGEAYYSIEADSIKAVDILTGAMREAYRFVWPETGLPTDDMTHEYLWSFFLYENSDSSIDVGYIVLTQHDTTRDADDGSYRISESNQRLTSYPGGRQIIETTLQFFQPDIITYRIGEEINILPRRSRYLEFPTRVGADQRITSYALKSVNYAGEYHEDASKVWQKLNVNGAEIDESYFQFYDDNHPEKYCCNICLSDLHNGRTGERIQAVQCINAEDGISTTKNIIVLRNGENVTSDLTSALGISSLDIMGIIDVTGIV